MLSMYKWNAAKIAAAAARAKKLYFFNDNKNLILLAMLDTITEKYNWQK